MSMVVDIIKGVLTREHVIIDITRVAFLAFGVGWLCWCLEKQTLGKR